MKRFIIALAALLITSFAIAQLLKQDEPEPWAVDPAASPGFDMLAPEIDISSDDLIAISPSELELEVNIGEPVAEPADVRQSALNPPATNRQPPRLVKPKFSSPVQEEDRLAMIGLFGPENQQNVPGEDASEAELNADNQAIESQDEDLGGDFPLDEVSITPPQQTENDPIGGDFNPDRFLGQPNEVGDIRPLPTSPATKPAPPAAQPKPIREPETDQDLIEHAGGAIQLWVNHQWQVKEQPIGREIRVLLLPTEAEAKQIYKAEVPAGIWLTHHVNRSGSLSPEKLLDDREKEMGEGVNRVSRTEVKIAGLPALLDDVIVDDVRRILIAIRADWGVCEIQAWAPRDEFVSDWQQWQTMLEKIKIGQPRAPQHADAAAPLGLWKSHHGYVHFLEDGRLKLAEDETVALGFEKQHVKKEKPLPPLVGTFKIEDDLVKIEWQDGSQLNFRWKVVDDQLRITDHLGRIARLRRIYF